MIVIFNEIVVMYSDMNDDTYRAVLLYLNVISSPINTRDLKLLWKSILKMMRDLSIWGWQQSDLFNVRVDRK